MKSWLVRAALGALSIGTLTTLNTGCGALSGDLQDILEDLFDEVDDDGFFDDDDDDDDLDDFFDDLEDLFD